MKELYIIQILFAALALVNPDFSGHITSGTSSHGAVGEYGRVHGIYGIRQGTFPPRPYQFNYVAPDAGSFHYRREKKDANGNVQGSYGYVDHQGLYRQVSYMVNLSGFKANRRTSEPSIVSKKNPADVYRHAQASSPGLQGKYNLSPGFGNYGSSIVQSTKKHGKSRGNGHHGNGGDAYNIRRGAHMKGTTTRRSTTTSAPNIKGRPHVKGTATSAPNIKGRPYVKDTTTRRSTTTSAPNIKGRPYVKDTTTRRSTTTSAPNIKGRPHVKGIATVCHGVRASAHNRRSGAHVKGMEVVCHSTTTSAPNIKGVVYESRGPGIHGIGSESHIITGGYIGSRKKGDIGGTKLSNTFEEIQRNFHFRNGY